MKRIHIFYLLVATFLMVISGLCAQNRGLEPKGRLWVESSGIKEINDSLQLSLVMRIRGKAVMEDCQAILLIPELTTADSEGGYSRVGLNTEGKGLLFPYIRISGEDRQKLDDRYFHLASIERFFAYKQPLIQIKAKEGADTTFIYNWQVPYEPWMNSARLVLHQQIAGCRQESTLYSLALNDKVEFEAPAAYQVNPQLSYLIPDRETKKGQSTGIAYLDIQNQDDPKASFLFPDGETKERDRRHPAHLSFPAGQSVILRDFGRNSEELQKINRVVSGVKNDADRTITGLFIQGYASPEGMYALNERLSQARVVALKDHLKNEFGLKESLFRLNSIAEDWEGLVALVQASDIAYKNQILEIIATTGIMNGREGALMRLAKGEPYRQMLREMFPRLRKVEFRIDYTIRDYTVEESKAVLAQKPENLSQLELFRLAQSYGKGSEEYINILTEVIPRYYPNDVAARVNASAVLIEQADLNAAKRLLENGGNAAISSHPAVQNNLGVIYLKSGDLGRSEALFEKSAAAGNQQAVYNQKEVQAKRQSLQGKKR